MKLQQPRIIGRGDVGNDPDPFSSREARETEFAFIKNQTGRKSSKPPLKRQREEQEEGFIVGGDFRNVTTNTKAELGFSF